MSLSIEKLSENDIPLAIDTESGDIIYYNYMDDDGDSDSDLDDVYITEEEFDALDDILDEYKGIKYRNYWYDRYKALKKGKDRNICSIIKGGPFLPLPMHNKIEEQIQHLVISGMQGSGKSHFGGQYVGLYIEKFPDNDIYLFSRKTSDPAFDQYPKIYRIQLDETFFECEINTDDLEKCLVIFDDIEQLEPNIRKEVYKFRDIISEIGRCKQIYIIDINHLPLGGKSTKTINNELTACVVFPASTKYHSMNLLTKYVGVSKKDATRILNKKTRWCYVNKIIPPCIITRNKIELL